MIRQYLPKGVDLSQADQHYLNQVAMSLNTRPRKALDWYAPLEKFVQLVNYHQAFKSVASHVWICLVCFDDLTAEQSKAITLNLKEKGLGWWHWIDDVWFVVDSSGKFSAKEIRDALKSIANQKMIVVELNENGDTWAGVRADDPDQKMFNWIKEIWKK